MRQLFLKFPPILAGNGDATSYLVLAGIILLVGAIFYFVYRTMQADQEAK